MEPLERSSTVLESKMEISMKEQEELTRAVIGKTILLNKKGRFFMLSCFPDEIQDLTHFRQTLKECYRTGFEVLANKTSRLVEEGIEKVRIALLGGGKKCNYLEQIATATMDGIRE